MALLEIPFSDTAPFPPPSTPPAATPSKAVFASLGSWVKMTLAAMVSGKSASCSASSLSEMEVESLPVGESVIMILPAADVLESCGTW